MKCLNKSDLVNNFQSLQALSNTETDRATAQVIIGVVSCALSAGIVFGFAALKPILVDRDAYRELCTDEELKDGVVICYKQDLKYARTRIVRKPWC
jgi:hypothetical protein